MSFNVDGARARVLAAMREGKWDIVEAELTAYAAAVRAEERHRRSARRWRRSPTAAATTAPAPCATASAPWNGCADGGGECLEGRCSPAPSPAGYSATRPHPAGHCRAIPRYCPVLPDRQRIPARGIP
jgi:hypothetical protein